MDGQPTGPKAADIMSTLQPWRLNRRELFVRAAVFGAGAVGWSTLGPSRAMAATANLTIGLHSITCLEEINEESVDEEVYVLVTTVSLRPPTTVISGIPPVPNFEVFRYGVYENFDEGDVVTVDGLQFWGPSSTPEDIESPDHAAMVVSLMENDNGSPEQYQDLLRDVVVPLWLASTAGEPNQANRAARLTRRIGDALNGVDVPIPFTLDDDHIGTQQLLLDPSDLIVGGTKDKVMRIESSEGRYELVFRITSHNLVESPWSGANDNWLSIGGYFPAGARVVATTRSADNFDLFTTGNDGRVYTSWWYAGSDWSGINDNWLSIGGVFPAGAPVTAIAKSPDSIDVFITGNDGRVYTSWWYAGAAWSGANDNWLSIGGFFPAGAPIAATSRNAGNLDLFITGNDGRVYTSWWYTDAPWSGANDNWLSVGGVFPAGAPVAAVARTPDNLDLFITGNDGRVYTSWWSTGAAWSGANDNWRSIGGFFPAGAPVTAIAKSPDSIDLFITGNDGRVYTSWWYAGSDWSGINDNWTPIGGFFPAGAPIAATTRSAGNLDLFITGNDGRVYTSWWYAGAAWSGANDNWTPIGGYFPVGASLGAVARTSNNLDLFIMGNDGRVYTSWWSG